MSEPMSEIRRYPHHPIYYVIAVRSVGGGVLMQYGLPLTIIDVIECDLADIDRIYGERVSPLIAAGQQVDARVYTREGDSPFREWAHRPEK